MSEDEHFPFLQTLALIQSAPLQWRPGRMGCGSRDGMSADEHLPFLQTLALIQSSRVQWRSHETRVDSEGWDGVGWSGAMVWVWENGLLCSR